jgi:AAA domain
MTINGFRSLRAPQKIDLDDGRCLCLLADNGRGKSSIVDALEFWSTGSVEWTRRDGVGLGALVHLDADTATVEVKTDGGVASRVLKGTTAGPLTAGQGPMVVGFEPDPIPILRNRTMAAFVDKTANDKRTELLTMLGLSKLVPFRLGLRAAARWARSELAGARNAAEIARTGWERALDGKDVAARLAELSTAAQLDDRITTEDQLLHLQPPAAASIPAATRLAQVDELASANTGLATSSVAPWNTAVADRRIAAERGLSALLDAGQRVLAAWDKDSCPLCLVEQPRSELAKRLRDRAAELADADARFATAVTHAEAREQAIVRLGRALRTVVDDDRNAEWSHLEAAHTLLAELRSEAAATKEALRTRGILTTSAPTLPTEALNELRESALRTPGDAGPALLALSQLRGLLQARIEADEAVAQREAITSSIEKAADIGETAVRKAIDDALSGLNETLGNFYGKLVGQSPFTDVRLDYHEARAGGVEFGFVWDGREPVSPPQRVMSESQLGSLGLALFLAHLKVRPPDWRTMVLDDVVTSFDVVHRTRLVRLLVEEFSDWQVILCTHDPQLSRNVQDEAPGWKAIKVTSWSATDGPVFGESNVRGRLRERLQAGDAADELGGLARQAIEQALERPVRRLGLKIRHDPANTYSADEYRRALIDGLKQGGYAHANHSVLRRLATDGSVTNRACHFKDHDPGVTAADLEMLLDDLDELDAIFVCGKCQKRAWEVRTSTGHCQCSCGALSCA